MRKISIFVLMFSMLVGKSIAQQVSLTGKVINPDDKPIKKVFVYLANKPTLYCYSDSLGYFSLTDINTLVPEVRQNEIISFEKRKLSLYANNQSISVDVITIDGRPIMNIVNLDKNHGTFGLYPEAYISGLPKAIYIVRARVGSTFRSFKIQNIIPSGFPKGITQYAINNIVDNSISEPKSETKSGVLDTLVLVHDFYKSRKIPLDSFSIHFDTIHLNNFADYSIAEGFEPSQTYLYSGYANFTDIYSADSVRFIIDYDTLSILKGDLKIITIPVNKIGSLNNSIKFISGLHFEPSGTKFLQPVQISVIMKDSIPKDLVVFQCNDQGDTYFIPYKKLFTDSCSIVFNINHFSSIGIGTGNIPTKSDYSNFTTSDQFESYLASYLSNYGNFDALPKDFFTIWFNNVVAPMISKIITWEDFRAALDEFLLEAETWMKCGMGHTLTDLPFWDLAREMFCEKMMKIWNDCIVEYNGLGDYCLKRAILDIALSIVEENQLLGGKIFCTNLAISESISLKDLFNVFGNGELFHLANKIEFSTPVKHLEVGDSYVVHDTLISLSGNTIPEVVIWSSSNTSVATIDANGKVIALKDGVTTIKGKICDIENTLKVEVGGGVNCEKDYCLNKYDSCYSETYRYKCTGVLSFTRQEGPYWPCGLQTVKWKERFTLVSSLGYKSGPEYFETIGTWISDGLYDPYVDKCYSTNTMNNSYDISNLAFECLGTAMFVYDPFSGFPLGWHAYLKEDYLILDVKEEYNNGTDYTYATTKCTCINIGK